MNTRRYLTCLLIALMLTMSAPVALAADSDGDGVDDAQDDFPNDPCASTDTDGDGLPDTVVANCVSSTIVGYTSFEDPFTISSTKYNDTGSASTSRFLWNNVNEPHVAHNQTNGSEMGFTLYYESTGGVGLTDEDYFGTIDYTGTVGNFTDGNNGYQMSDVDGITTLTLDTITADSVTLDLFIQDTGYESADYLIIRWVSGGVENDLINTTGDDIDVDYSSYLDVWTTLTHSMSSATGNLQVEFSSNAGYESIYLDNVIFTGSGSLAEDLDDDNDGWSDVDEADCGTSPTDANEVPTDADGNGICDASESNDTDGDGIPNDSDTDDDNDGVEDTEDAFPLDPEEWNDNDHDGVGDNSDADDDNDGWSDVIEMDCNTDSIDATSFPNDTDSDGACDFVDFDDDGDGVNDHDDTFPLDASESSDNDADGLGDNADTDDDNDGWSDLDEMSCYTDALDSDSTPGDDDGDGVCNYLDSDRDNDGVNDLEDSYPDDPCASTDTDDDGYPDSIQTDCSTTLVADEDDDDDGWNDIDEYACGSHSQKAEDIPSDFDDDDSCDAVDADDDNDGVADEQDAFPQDALEWSDTDSDGEGDNADLDDDGDGWPDLTEDACGSDSLVKESIPNDSDSDGQCDIQDLDRDGDGVADDVDAFADDSTEWSDLDGDGIGDNADTDDDGDSYSDAEEAECNSDPNSAESIPKDWDQDGLCDAMDADIQPIPSNETPGFTAIFGALALLGAAFASARKRE